METIRLLKELKRTKAINQQAFKTYKGQILSGNELGCIRGLLKKKLITQEKSNDLISSMQLCNYAYRTRG